ncbi:unnamed protein product [Ectocarpus sp. CCAP 1310/34]|nr:unnamed protein product [Ectocarpus sp. CCAP 1310/34]
MFDEAGPLLMRAEAIGKKAFGPDHPDVAVVLNNRSSFLARQVRRLRRVNNAFLIVGLASNVHHSHRYLKASFGPEVLILSMIAYKPNRSPNCFVSQGNYAEAKILFESSLAIHEKVHGRDHPEVATVLENIAELLMEQEMYEEAEPLVVRCLAIRQSALGPEHPDVASSLQRRASLLDVQGKHDKAKPLLERSVAINEATFGSEHPHVVASLNDLAAVLEKQVGVFP